MNQMETIIKSFVALIWAVLGLVVWIPILFRIMIIHIFNIFKITVLEEDLPTKDYCKLLVDTSCIYQNGFKNIFSDEGDGKINRPKRNNGRYNLIMDIFWAVIFWGSIILPFIIKSILG
jgi:hypothetical protein